MPCGGTLQALRLEPHHVVSNHTGIPLQMMHFQPRNMKASLARGAVEVNRATTASGLPRASATGPSGQPGLKGAVHEPDVDWTSVLDLPAGASRHPPHMPPLLGVSEGSVHGQLSWLVSCPVRLMALSRAGQDGCFWVPVGHPHVGSAIVAGLRGRLTAQVGRKYSRHSKLKACHYCRAICNLPRCIAHQRHLFTGFSPARW